MQSKDTEFKSILADNHERLYRICSYYFKNKEDRSDLYQEILYNIWKSLGSFKGKSSINTWIYRIALNTAIGYAGREYLRRKSKADIDLHLNLDHLLYDDTDQKQILENSIEELYVKLNQLSVIDKTIMTLMLEEIPTKEIADIVGITEPNVRVKIHRIKNQLKIEMKGYSYEERR